MTEISFKSAGVSARVLNRTGPTAIKPAGLPAGVIGTAEKGPAFVPVTLPTPQDFVVDFGLPTDTKANGPMAGIEWLRNSQALTFLRVLGAGSGKTRESGTNAGRVANAGFVAGQQLPQRPGAAFGDNTFVNTAGEGDKGRTYFLGCFMKQSGSSTFFTDAGKPSEGVPVIRGILMAASGVFLSLSSSLMTDNAPAATGDAASATSVTGSVNIASGRQEFVMIQHGFNNVDSTAFKNVLTASFDPTAPNYLNKIFNTDPFMTEEAGHLLYTDYKIHPSLAIPTGSGIVAVISGAGGAEGETSTEDIAFLLNSTQSVSRNSGNSTVPNYENFEDRFQNARSVFVVSQKFGGSPENLFKISALGDGVEPNDKMKFSIENIVPGTDAEPYGRFDLLVRVYDDNDKNRNVLEAWRGVNLNPDSQQYIARIVGDNKDFFNFDAPVGSQKVITEGIYEAKSRFIRIEVPDKVANAELDKSAVPFGFRGAPHLVTSGTNPMPDLLDFANYYTKTNPFKDLVQIPVPLREHIGRGVAPNLTADSGLYWGVQFEEKISAGEPNSSTAPEENILALSKYFPTFHTTFQNVVVSENAGAADTAENGVLDADRFLNNAFSLANIRISIDSDDVAKVNEIAAWRYVRPGNITATANSRSLAVADLTDSSVRNVAKFSFYIHGGYDGVNVLDREMSDITNGSVTEEMNNTNRGITDGPSVISYDRALDIMADQTEVDIQLLAVPGIRHTIITDKGLLVTEERFDAVFIMDLDEYDVTNPLVTGSEQLTSVRHTGNRFADRGLSTAFGSAYFPHVILRDSFTGRTRQVAPSVAVLGAFAKNDAVAFPWFAPAGFTRGALETTDAAALRLSRDNMDTLQEFDINPLVSFAGSDGVVVWGQKTLLATDSSLERVNVRRLLVDIRRKVKAIANRLLFEPNREETLARFSQLVNPVLKKIQDQKGLEKFLVRIDTTTTTQADVQNRTIRGKIFLTPTKTLEFLSVDFVVTNQAE